MPLADEIMPRPSVKSVPIRQIERCTDFRSNHPRVSAVRQRDTNGPARPISDVAFSETPVEFTFKFRG